MSSVALPRPARAVEGGFTRQVKDLPGRALVGEVVYVGRGCLAWGGSPEDPYLADPEGRIALIDRGHCPFAQKIGRAQRAGAIGVILFDAGSAGEPLPLSITGLNPVTLPDGTTLTIAIPAVLVGHLAGVALRDAAPVAVEVQ